jgi:hypothetical protein
VDQDVVDHVVQGQKVNTVNVMVMVSADHSEEDVVLVQTEKLAAHDQKVNTVHVVEEESIMSLMSMTMIIQSQEQDHNKRRKSQRLKKYAQRHIRS